MGASIPSCMVYLFFRLIAERFGELLVHRKAIVETFDPDYLNWNVFFLKSNNKYKHKIHRYIGLYIAKNRIIANHENNDAVKIYCQNIARFGFYISAY